MQNREDFGLAPVRRDHLGRHHHRDKPTRSKSFVELDDDIVAALNVPLVEENRKRPAVPLLLLDALAQLADPLLVHAGVAQKYVLLHAPLPIRFGRPTRANGAENPFRCQGEVASSRCSVVAPIPSVVAACRRDLPWARSARARTKSTCTFGLPMRFP